MNDSHFDDTAHTFRDFLFPWRSAESAEWRRAKVGCHQFANYSNPEAARGCPVTAAEIEEGEGS